MNQCLPTIEPGTLNRSTQKLSNRNLLFIHCHFMSFAPAEFDLLRHKSAFLKCARRHTIVISHNKHRFPDVAKVHKCFHSPPNPKKLVHLTIAQHNLSVNLILVHFLSPYGKFQTNMCRPYVTNEKRFHTQLITWTIKLECNARWKVLIAK